MIKLISWNKLPPKNFDFVKFLKKSGALLGHVATQKTYRRYSAYKER